MIAHRHHINHTGPRCDVIGCEGDVATIVMTGGPRRRVCVDHLREIKAAPPPPKKRRWPLALFVLAVIVIVVWVVVTGR